MNDITEIVGRLRKLDADAAAISAAISDRSKRGHTANGALFRVANVLHDLHHVLNGGGVPAELTAVLPQPAPPSELVEAELVADVPPPRSGRRR